MIAFGWVTNLIQRGMASWKRILEILDTPPAITDAAATAELTSVAAIRGDIEFRNLTFAYPVQGLCPAKFAHALPQISLIYRYPTTGTGNVFLASGGQVSGHADFFNGWMQSDLQALVDGCLNALRHCQRAA